MIKIEKNDQNINPFGGINFVLDQLKEEGIPELIDNQLGQRAPQAIYSYSDLILNLWSVFFCGGDRAEDINEHLKTHLEDIPDNKVANADTILSVLKKLKTETEQVESSSGKIYNINKNDKLNQLLISTLKQLNMLVPGNSYDFDYDNEVLPTEKYDTKRTYKKNNGYFPGMATISGMPVYMENRDGNMNVKTDQASLLERSYKMLNDNGIDIDRSRMDAGSYSLEIVKVVEENSNLFYIRANRCAALTKELLGNPDWDIVEINNIIYEVCSIEYTPFKGSTTEEPSTYRLVVSREQTKDTQMDMLTGDSMKYRSILTNDVDSSEKEVIVYYNQRGTEETVIDVLNNDFGWSKMPFSFIGENTVFLTIMMICKNIYTWIVKKFSQSFPSLKPNFRIKKFIFRFIIVPAKWITRSRGDILKIYSKKPYELLKQ